MREAIVFESADGVQSPPMWIPDPAPWIEVVVLRLPSLFDGGPDIYKCVRFLRTEECVEIDSIAVTIYRQEKLS